MKYKTISNTPYDRNYFFNPYCYWDNGFTNDELDLIENYCMQLESEIAEIFTDKNISEISNFRKSKIKFLNKVKDSQLSFLFDRLNSAITGINENYYNFDLNGYDHIQYTQYDSIDSGEYKYHIDMSTGKFSDLRREETRKLSLSLILSDPTSYEGGEFTMKLAENDSNDILIEQPRGRIIFFPSFFMHKVHPVTKGTRKSLVVWVEGPKFK
jgi:PKHD-type hydroxylase